MYNFLRALLGQWDRILPTLTPLKLRREWCLTRAE